ncbi:Lysophospholipase-like protein 1 [Frankliniella fusca]|uniref:palmitoyl-protein hydrolase n=1 Tax=Frankliniella fusca TaxID=407009 RepID=A0AAE1I3U0_9NEOP|nr:Lysophospholipase-like protein 1 [Frankliniella fusca]
MALGNVLITKPLEEIKEEGKECTGTVIFLHGSGDTGRGVFDWVKSLHKFSFPHIRVLFPTAPLLPFTPNGGMPSNVWFNRLKLSPDAPEHMETTEATAKELVNIVNSEVKRGIPLHRIVIGGFSMGGGMSLHLGYRYLKGVAGVFALSSFLSYSSSVYKSLENDKASRHPPLFMCHGTADDLILEQWGKETYSNLSKLGVRGEYNLLPNVAHELDRKELAKLSSWIMEQVPEKI